MPRYSLRTLLILLAIGPPMLAWVCWPTVQRLLWPAPKRIQGNLHVISSPPDGKWIELHGLKASK